MNTTPKPSHIATLAGGGIVVIFSFLSFYKSTFGGATFSAWSGDFLFPLSAFPALFGLVVAGTTAATVFGNVSLPEPILGFTWKQLNVMFAYTALVLLVGFLISAPAGADIGVGLIISVLGGLAMMAGTMMEHLGIEAGSSSSGSGQAPGGPPTQF